MHHVADAFIGCILVSVDVAEQGEQHEEAENHLAWQERVDWSFVRVSVGI